MSEVEMEMDVRRFQPYPEYKDSGVEWLGEVPVGWEVNKMKFLTIGHPQYGANEAAEDTNHDQPRYIRITDIDDSGSLRKDTFRSLSEDIAKPYILKHGDILLARSGATVGKSFIYDESWGRACYAGYLIRFRIDQSKALSKFIYYFTQSESYRNWLSGIFIQSTIQNVSADKYANLFISTPPLSEQRIITTFLNVETSKIDALIAKEEQLIELLKEQRSAVISHAVTKGLDPSAEMNGSGVEWLGEIPVGWKVEKLKCLAYITYGLGQPPKELSGGLPLLRATNVERGKINPVGLVFVDPADIPYERNPVLQTNDIIVVRSGAYTGDSAIVPPEYNGAIAGYDMIVRTRLVNPKYIAYSLLSPPILNCQIDLFRARAAQPHLNAEQLGEILFAIPTSEIQEDVVNFLDRETSKIDALIVKVNEAIERLREYRTALIAAAVTGKINVREEVE
ncbi:MAG: restriction endonuclease subunit S [Candidatus Kapaibacterium sp.]